MNKSRNWIITASILLAAGALVCAISLAALGFDLTRLNTRKYVAATYTVDDDFKNISIKADTEIVELLPSDDTTCMVVCYEEEDNPHIVTVDGDSLSITSGKNAHWWLNIGIMTESPKISVYLPKNSYDRLSVSNQTGDVSIPKDFSFSDIDIDLNTGNIDCAASASGDISISTDTGKIAAADITASSLVLKSDTGRISVSNVKISGDVKITENTGALYMNSVLAGGDFNLESDTGNIEFAGCDAKNLYIKTDTGSVTGSLLSDKIFLADTDTGRISVPKSVSGGKCEITTDTGNINITTAH